MLYETARGNPEPGTIKEMVFLLVYTMREDAEFQGRMFQGMAAVAAGSESEDAGKQLQKSLKEYMNTQFPYMRAKAEDEEKKLREVLVSETKNRAFRVTRIHEPWKRRKR